MDGLVGDPIDILDLGPFRSGAEGSRIGSTLVRIPVGRKRSLYNNNTSVKFLSYFAGVTFYSLFYDLPGACEVCQIKYHALGERYLGPGIILRPVGQATYQGRPEKIWQLLSVNTSRPLYNSD